MRALLTLSLAVLAGHPAIAAAQDASREPVSTERRLSDVESEIQALWRSYFVVVRDDLPNSRGSLDCASGRYDEIRASNSYLVFFVACEAIEPYDAGYRATIALGNPHTFAFTRVSGTLSYGENVAAALVKEKQRVPFSSAGELKPGTWIRIRVPIAAAEARDVTKLIVQFEVSGAMGRADEPPARPTTTPQHGLLHPR